MDTGVTVHFDTIIKSQAKHNGSIENALKLIKNYYAIWG